MDVVPATPVSREYARHLRWLQAGMWYLTAHRWAGDREEAITSSLGDHLAWMRGNNSPARCQLLGVGGCDVTTIAAMTSGGDDGNRDGNAP